MPYIKKDDFAKLLNYETALKDLLQNHIELVVAKDCCYFKIKGSKGKEKSFTSYILLEYWKDIMKELEL